MKVLYTKDDANNVALNILDYVGCHEQLDVVMTSYIVNDIQYKIVLIKNNTVSEIIEDAIECLGKNSRLVNLFDTTIYKHLQSIDSANIDLVDIVLKHEATLHVNIAGSRDKLEVTNNGLIINGKLLLHEDICISRVESMLHESKVAKTIVDNYYYYTHME